ncbi:calumenin-like [Tachypleus tridentatus]|uniref:calumenin-like n=1 Tax=Tachypleus tridentatus TaxID=6853 RepID=UPI003FD1850A
MEFITKSCVLGVVFIIAINAQEGTHSSTQDDNSHNQHPSAGEIKKHLEHVVDSYIDKNKDGYVTVEELKDWVKFIHERGIQESVDQQWMYYEPQVEELLTWEGYNPEQKEVLTWDKYKNLTFPEYLFDETQKPEDLANLKEMLRRSERRWKLADASRDGLLTKEEFQEFLHPEESTRVSEVLVLEAIEDMDGDKNNEVSLEEYMEHLKKVSGQEKEDPSWASTQQNHFTNYLDKNKDGALNKDEVKDWILPSQDRYEGEAWHLVSLVDSDRDTKITKHDITANHQFFVGLIPSDYLMQHDSNQRSKDEF